MTNQVVWEAWLMLSLKFRFRCCECNNVYHLNQPYLNNKMLSSLSGYVLFSALFANCVPHEATWKHFIVYIYVLKLIMPFKMTKFIRLLKPSVKWYQIEKPLKSQRRCWSVTCMNYRLFFSTECAKSNVIFVSTAENSRDLSSLELSPAPHMCYHYMKQNYLRVKHSWM